MLKLYNTLTKEKEIFEPIDKENNLVRMYSCGLTVYNYAHIGNMRTYIFMDTLRKVLKYNGYNLLHVMNITDVGHLTSDADEGEDKMAKSAREQNLSVYEIAKKYTEAYQKDFKKLNTYQRRYIASEKYCIDKLKLNEIMEQCEALCGKKEFSNVLAYIQKYIGQGC